MKKTTSILISIAFLANSMPSMAMTQSVGDVLALPAAGAMVPVSPSFNPALIKGLIVHQDNPFLFDFIVDPGQDYRGIIARSEAQRQSLKDQADRMIKYFFAALTVPDKDVWVNLSPYEKDRIVPVSLGQTAMGRDLLAQDYLLKQLTASLIYPQNSLGKAFWQAVYSKAKALYGTTQVPVNTFNKVWIVPQRAGIYEHGQTAYIVDSHLKVMLEEDYLATTKHNAILNPQIVIPAKAGPHGPHAGHSQMVAGHSLMLGIHNKNNTNTLSSPIIRQIILPEIEKEVNEGKNFATLRQIFYSQVLAVWFKHNLKQALLVQVYANKGTVKGIDQNTVSTNEAIYQQYLKAYKKGVFNYVQEDVDPITQYTMPRKYFSGGYDGESLYKDIVVVKPSDMAQISPQTTSHNILVTALVGINRAQADRLIQKVNAAMIVALKREKTHDAAMGNEGSSGIELEHYDESLEAVRFVYRIPSFFFIQKTITELVAITNRAKSILVGRTFRAPDEKTKESILDQIIRVVYLNISGDFEYQNYQNYRALIFSLIGLEKTGSQSVMVYKQEGASYKLVQTTVDEYTIVMIGDSEGMVTLSAGKKFPTKTVNDVMLKFYSLFKDPVKDLPGILAAHDLLKLIRNPSYEVSSGSKRRLQGLISDEGRVPDDVKDIIGSASQDINLAGYLAGEVRKVEDLLAHAKKPPTGEDNAQVAVTKVAEGARTDAVMVADGSDAAMNMEALNIRVRVTEIILRMRMALLTPTSKMPLGLTPKGHGQWSFAPGNIVIVDAKISTLVGEQLHRILIDDTAIEDIARRVEMRDAAMTNKRLERYREAEQFELLIRSIAPISQDSLTGKSADIVATAKRILNGKTLYAPNQQVAEIILGQVISSIYTDITGRPGSNFDIVTRFIDFKKTGKSRRMLLYQRLGTRYGWLPETVYEYKMVARDSAIESHEGETVVLISGKRLPARMVDDVIEKFSSLFGEGFLGMLVAHDLLRIIRNPSSQMRNASKKKLQELGLMSGDGSIPGQVKHIIGSFLDSDVERQLADINAKLENTARRAPKIEDNAQLSTTERFTHGGIDLSEQDAAMRVIVDANGGVRVNVDPALIARVEREGLSEVVPVIINMGPADMRAIFKGQDSMLS